MHVIGPELGLTQPGMTIVCGDSHTSTHGAFGALAFGIGTSEVEHVLATQTLLQTRPKTMLVRFDGELPFGVTAKDMVLGAIGRIGVAGGVGHAIEYAGPAIEALSMEGRMTVCNMSIEAGARAGMIAPDETTFAYLEGRPARAEGRRVGARARRVARAADRRRARRSTDVVEIDVSALDPARDLGDEPRHGRAGRRPRARPGRVRRPGRARGGRARARLHGPRAGHADPARSRIDRVFIGSCTNARIEDLRAAAAVVERPARREHACARWSCPGSAQVKRAGGGGGPRPRVHERGLRVARGGLLDVPRHEPGHPRAGRALRLDLEPQLRGPAGRGGRTHLVSPGDGRGRRDRRPLHRRAGAGMRELRQVTGRAAVLDRADVDTDQIIPKQFLKRIERSGYGEFLFYDWMKDPDFELRRPEYEGAQILVAGRNFGCGSSREHAAWALEDYGFRAVLAPSYSDIFRSNAVKSGLAPLELPEEALEQIKAALAARNELTVDLEALEISHPDGLRVPFELDDVHPRDARPRPRRRRADAPPRGADRRLRGDGAGAVRHDGAGEIVADGDDVADDEQRRRLEALGQPRDLVQLARDGLAVGLRAARDDGCRCVRARRRARSGARRCR